MLDAHLEANRARVGDVVLEIGDHGAEHGPGRIYVRPHDVEVGRTETQGAVPARVLRVTPLSAGLKVELQAEGLGSSVRADIDWERGAALGLRGGEDVFVSLRRARVFNENRDRIAA